jgi:hypothetical protein
MSKFVPKNKKGFTQKQGGVPYGRGKPWVEVYGEVLVDTGKEYRAADPRKVPGAGHRDSQPMEPAGNADYWKRRHDALAAESEWMRKYYVTRENYFKLLNFAEMIVSSLANKYPQVKPVCMGFEQILERYYDPLDETLYCEE